MHLQQSGGTYLHKEAAEHHRSLQGLLRNGHVLYSLCFLQDSLSLVLPFCLHTKFLTKHLCAHTRVTSIHWHRLSHGDETLDTWTFTAARAMEFRTPAHRTMATQNFASDALPPDPGWPGLQGSFCFLAAASSKSMCTAVSWSR